MVRIVRETAGEFFARSRLGGREARGLDGGYGVKILNGCGADLNYTPKSGQGNDP